MRFDEDLCAKYDILSQEIKAKYLYYPSYLPTA